MSDAEAHPGTRVWEPGTYDPRCAIRLVIQVSDNEPWPELGGPIEGFQLGVQMVDAAQSMNRVNLESVVADDSTDDGCVAHAFDGNRYSQYLRH
jgi:hypothetical protein